MLDRIPAALLVAAEVGFAVANCRDAIGMTKTRLASLHRTTHAGCFIANSMKTEIVVV